MFKYVRKVSKILGKIKGQKRLEHRAKLRKNVIIPSLLIAYGTFYNFLHQIRYHRHICACLMYRASFVKKFVEVIFALFAKALRTNVQTARTNEKLIFIICLGVHPSPGLEPSFSQKSLRSYCRQYNCIEEHSFY
jgi:hypothetical protein